MDVGESQVAQSRLTASPRLLLVGEAVTFAHVARICAIEDLLKTREFEVHCAYDSRFDKNLDAGRAHLPLRTKNTEAFVSAVNAYKFPYSESELRESVEEDLRLLDTVQPDLVIADFRITMAISGRLRQVPSVTLTNGYWLPECREPIVKPRLEAFEYLPQRLAPVIRSVAFRFAAQSFNRVARQFGCADLAGDLAQVYTQADHVLVVEPPGWLLLNKTESRITPIGPLRWESSQPLPVWWDDLDPERPLLYFNVGSSGSSSYFQKVREALKNERVSLVAAGLSSDFEVGASSSSSYGGEAKIYVERFLNSRAVLEHSQLFLSNGGSLSMVDALRSGVPVVGLTSNYDQVLNMTVASRRGVGQLFTESVTVDELRSAIQHWLKPNSNTLEELSQAQAMFHAPANSFALTSVICDLLRRR